MGVGEATGCDARLGIAVAIDVACGDGVEGDCITPGWNEHVVGDRHQIIVEFEVPLKIEDE